MNAPDNEKKPPGRTGRDSRVTCESFCDWSDIEPRAREWDALVERVGGGIFATFNWCRTWWEFYGRGSLEIRIVRSGDDLVAVFPFFRETQRLGGLPVRLLRLVGCDHAGPVGAVPVEPGMEDRAVEALAASLADEEFSNWDLIHIGLLPGYAERTKELSKAFERHFPAARVGYYENVAARVLIELPGSFEEFLRGLSKRERSNIRQDDRRIRREHDVEQIVVTSPDGFGDVLQGFFDSHERLWRSKGKPGWFNEWPDAKAFHRRLAEVLAPRGECFITELAADGDVIAAEYCFRFGDLIHWFQPTRENSKDWRKYSLGRIGFLNLVRYAISVGATLIDGGGAPYEYKLRIGGRLAGDGLIVVSRRKLYSRVKVRLFRTGAWVVHTIYGRGWRRFLAPKLGLDGRGFWRAWIRSRMVFPSRGAHVEPAERLQGKEESQS